MNISKSHLLAITTIGFLLIGLVVWGSELLFIPPVIKQARLHSTFWYYQGYLLIAVAILLLCFHRLAIKKIMWIYQEVHRWMSALMMMGVVMIDSSMHLLSIPHMEGWWLPIFGGSAFITGMSAWLHQWRKKPQDLEADEV